MRGMAAAYQGAIEAVLAVVLATLAGYWVDGRFATSPTFLLIGLVLGFAAFCLRLWRLRDLMAGPPGQGPKPPEST
jgi:F0F1-type ATP synthase assembly protein I